MGHVLESTVPKRVQPPRFLTVMVVSGITLALTLFGYSTTQIYLRFSEPPDAEGALPGAGATPAPTADPGGAAPADPGGSAPDGSTSVSTVSYQTVETSSGSFTGQVTVTNTGGSSLDDWELALGFADATVTDAWDVDWERTRTGIVARQPDWADPVGPGDSVTVSFTAEGEAQSPDSCALNGAPCDL
ncbi:cellulose binding domain-containing protein [Nocardiopsis sediminis]|uniref:Cellulose binding domain-containing protein n=1 Tax=Nocardiopsis sediminis TaxID=1778267 RepID=A0ABV8FXU0_9ACTN